MPGKNARSAKERSEIVATLERWFEGPLLILGILWLVLLVIELTRGLTPLLDTVSAVIWIVFIVDFALKLLLAPDRLAYIRTNWLTAFSLALPALRILRVFRVLSFLRAARVLRGVRLVRVLTSINRGLRALGASFGRRGFGYVVAASFVVWFGGAAGMYAFENGVANTELDSYGSSLWWTAMLLTSIGSETFPKTAEGRVLCFLVSLYGFVVFGYLTASLASFFVERDAAAPASPTPSAKTLNNLTDQVALLREDITALSRLLKNSPDRSSGD